MPWSRSHGPSAPFPGRDFLILWSLECVCVWVSLCVWESERERERDEERHMQCILCICASYLYILERFPGFVMRFPGFVMVLWWICDGFVMPIQKMPYWPGLVFLVWFFFLVWFCDPCPKDAVLARSRLFNQIGHLALRAKWLYSTFRNSLPWTFWELPNVLPCGRLRRRTFKSFSTAKTASTVLYMCIYCFSYRGFLFVFFLFLTGVSGSCDRCPQDSLV